MNKIRNLIFTILSLTLLIGNIPVSSSAAEYTQAKLYPDYVYAWTESDKNLQREATKAIYDKILKAVENGDETHTVPKGDYRVCNDYINKFIIRNAKDITIDFQGSTIWVEGWSTALEIYESSNVTIKNLIIDYDPLPYVQGTVTAVNKEENSVDLLLDDGSYIPDKDWCAQDGSQMKFIPFSADGKMLPQRMNWSAAQGYTILDDNNIRVKIMHEYIFNDLGAEQIVPGIKIAIPWRRGGAIVIDYCDYVTLENVDLFASQGMGIRYHWGKGGHLFKNVRIIPRPETGRLLSSNADGMHGYMMEDAGTVDSCEFRALGDDCINSNAFMHFVYKIVDPTHLFVGTFYSETLRAGQELAFVDLENGDKLGNAKISKISTVDDSLLVTNVSQIASTIKTEVGISCAGKMNGYKLFYVELDTPVKVKHFDFVIPIYANTQYTVRNSTFYDTIAHGILSKIPNTTIENCYFGRNALGAIKIEADRYWFEGSTDIENVLIRNNTFESNSKNYYMHEPEIAIGNNFSANDPNHVRNVEISGNRFINLNAPVLNAQNVSGLKFENNAVEWNDKPIVKKYYDFDTLIKIGVSDGVSVSSNTYTNMPSYIKTIVSASSNAQNFVTDR